MSKVESKLNLSQVGRVCVTVADTDRAIEFYVDTLGFEKVVDVPMGEEMRWVEVAPAAFGQRLDGEPVAGPLHEYDCASRHGGIEAA